MSGNSSKVIAIVAGSICAVFLVCGIGAGVAYKYVQKQAENRRADRRSVSDLGEAAKRAQAGGALGNVEFPDTPVGRMNRIVFDFMQQNQATATTFKTSLSEIGWDKVGLLEGMAEKAGVEENLQRIAKAKKVTDRFSASFEQSIHDAIEALKVEASKSQDGKDYFDGFTKTMDDPKSSLAITRQTVTVLRKNHNALEAQFRFLLKRTGHYTVDTGQILFDETVSDAALAEFNALAERSEKTMKELLELDKKQKANIDKAYDTLDKATKG